MRVTNTANLPYEFLAAVSNDPYDNQGSDYSVTDLIAPAQQVAIKKRYKDDIVHDAADLIWILLGRAIHHVIEYADVPDSWREQRKSITMRGLKISGQADIYNPIDGVITDVKSTSVYRTKDGLPKEWEQQLNLYAVLWRLNGLDVNALRVLTIYRDWRPAEAMKNRDYPRTAVAELDVPCWRQSTALDYLRGRVDAHMSAQRELETAGGEGLAKHHACSDHEKWRTPDKFAVMKKGRKKALKLCNSDAEAAELVAAKGASYFVEDRPGEDRRCQNYCDASPWCHQFMGSRL